MGVLSLHPVTWLGLALALVACAAQGTSAPAVTGRRGDDTATYRLGYRMACIDDEGLLGRPSVVAPEEPRRALNSAYAAGWRDGLQQCDLRMHRAAPTG